MYDQAATSVLAAFPRRPLILHPPPAPVGGRLLTMLSALFVIGLFIASLVWVLPPLQTDWQIRDTATQVRGRIENGRCHSKLIFHICDATLVASNQRTTIRRDITYLFVDFHFGDYTLDVMADPAQPTLLTTDLGLDKLYNRAISLAAAWFFMVAGVILGGRAAWRSSHMRNAVLAASGQVLVPVRLDLHGITGNRRTATWSVRDPSGGRTEWAMPAKAKPFMLGTGIGILGIAGPAGGAAFPLDAELRWIDLTDTERAQIFSAQARTITESREAETAFRMDHPG